MNASLSAADKRSLLARLLQQRAAEQLVYSPTTAGQQALWVLHGLYPQSPAYTVAFCSRIEGPLQVDALRRAIQGLVQRHPLLRARFLLHEGSLRQEIAGFRALPWEEIDASDWTEDRLDLRIRQDHERPFRLDREIPVRATLYRLGALRHVLLIDVHHIVFDAWSLWLCAGELLKLYAIETGSGETLAPPAARYEDYALDQERRWAGPEGERQLAFWRERLGGVQHPAAFPASRGRGERSEPKGASVHFRIDPELAAAARALATRLSVTPFTLYLATTLAVLHRYTGQDDLTLGCPSNGRAQHRFHDVVGYFVNPMAVRADLSGDPSFAGLAKRLLPRVLDSLAHQEYPFPRLVEQLDLPREPGRTPLFQALFNYHRPQGLAESLDRAMSGDGWPLKDLRIHHRPIDQQEGQFELVLDLLDLGGELQGTVKYRLDLYDAPFAERLASHFLNLLRAVVEAPDLPLSRLPMLDASETRQILCDWNPPAESPAAQACLHHPFLEQATRTPEALAAVCGDAELGYGELLRRASGLAVRLQGLGVGPESCVAVCLERSLEMLVAVLGIQLAGGAYVPLDTKSPDERLRGILGQCEARVLIARPERALALEGAAAHGLAIRGLEDIPMADAPPQSPVAPDNLAYIIFTSGSTGVPKGVMIEHRSALNTVQDINRRFDLGPKDRVIGLSSLGFDLSVYDIFGTLAAGAALVIPEHERSADPEHWLALLRRHRVSVWSSAPIMMEMLTGMLRAQRGALPESLRLVMMSGDWIPLGLPEQIRRHSSGAPRLISLGGATEASIWSICFPIEQIDPQWKSIPYGRPLEGQRFHVLDAALNPVPVGALGELYIGGVGVARGYLGRPDLTAERFIPDPFGAEGERLYRTGDLGRYFPDGNIEFLGRIDAQVKIRGFRVELGEIEVCLSRHPAVAETVVLPRELHRGVKDLVAYVVPQSSGTHRTLSTHSLQEHLRRSLPEYMVPVAFVTLDHFPMTTNGKLDRDALPLPELARPSDDRPYEAPGNELERVLCGLWSDVLEVTPLGIHDDFFELGGQSLLAVALLARIGETLGRELPLDALLHARTPAQMAQWLDRDEDPAEILVQMRPGDRHPPLFCIHPVGGNLLAYRELTERLAPGGAVYGIRSPGLLADESPLDDFSAMAERYLAAILKVRPQGPYRLCGWSLGGILALEIAARLEARGETVELVTMIDSYAQETGGRHVEESARLAWMARDIAGMAGLDDLGIGDLGTGREARDRLIARAQEIGAMPKDAPYDRLRRLCDVLEANLKAMFQHRPRVYRGPTLLIHACDAPEHHPAHPVAGWRHLLEDLSHRFVAGDHYTLLQSPQVDRVAELIDSRLARTTCAA